MIRVRFHGRGGQGAKTASRIVGTAVFHAGFTAQDSPIYGAERRGAPVAAFTRLARGPILERGVISRPDLVVVGDETLLHDPTARVLEGVTEDAAVFMNTQQSPERLRARSAVLGRLTTLDLTGMALARFGKVGSLSAPLGAVAVRLLGLTADSLRVAVAEELEALGMSPAVVDQNLALANECFNAVPTVPIKESQPEQANPASLWTPTYEPPTRGTARISAGGNMPIHKTGDWRIFRPVLDPDKCNGCWLCFVYCPEAAIVLTDKDRPVIDYDHCKGCMLCVEECPTRALAAARESEVRSP
jgi:pyruvate ferredoxin oxidoreductase gamma subunit